MPQPTLPTQPAKDPPKTPPNEPKPHKPIGDPPPPEVPEPRRSSPDPVGPERKRGPREPAIVPGSPEPTIRGPGTPSEWDGNVLTRPAQELRRGPGGSFDRSRPGGPPHGVRPARPPEGSLAARRQSPGSARAEGSVHGARSGSVVVVGSVGGTRARARLGAVGLAGAALLAACGGGASTAPGTHSAGDVQKSGMSQTFAGKNKCDATGHARPFVIEWDATDTSTFEARAKDDVLFVRYEGCDLQARRNESARQLGRTATEGPAPWR